jgi:hypothetical protein
MEGESAGTRARNFGLLLREGEAGDTYAKLMSKKRAAVLP